MVISGTRVRVGDGAGIAVEKAVGVEEGTGVDAGVEVSVCVGTGIAIAVTLGAAVVGARDGVTIAGAVLQFVRIRTSEPITHAWRTMCP